MASAPIPVIVSTSGEILVQAKLPAAVLMVSVPSTQRLLMLVVEMAAPLL